MRPPVVLLSLVMIVAACSPSPKAAKVEAPQPNPGMAAEFKDCTWGEVKLAPIDGTVISIWSFACPNARLIANDKLPGFELEQDMDAKSKEHWPVIRLYSKSATDSIDVIMPKVRIASEMDKDATCVFEPVKDIPDQFSLVPTGKTKAAYDQFLAGKAEGPSMPCGSLGPTEAGEHIFKIVPGSTQWVASIDLGSDIQPFDLKTLRVVD